MHAPFRLMDLQQTSTINENTETSKPDVNFNLHNNKREKDLDRMRVKGVEYE